MPLWKQHLMMACCGLFGGILWLLVMGLCSLYALRPEVIGSVSFFSACTGTFVAGYMVNQWLDANEDTAADIQPVGIVTLFIRIIVCSFCLMLLGMFVTGILLAGEH